MTDTEDLRAALTAEGPIRAKDLLSTGSTLLNLCLSGRARGGLLKGRYFYFVGDSSSGKTWLTLTCLAEATLNRNFDDYDFIFDDAEGGSLMDTTRFFGQGVTDRIRAPAMDKNGTPVHSTKVEEFYFYIDNALKRGRPFIYILDSMDALMTKEDEEKFKEDKKAFEEDKKDKGTYGVSQAKKNSRNIRTLMTPLRESGSILIIISQTRDNIDPFTAKFNPKTRAGGRALKFFATVEMWTSVARHEKKAVRGQQVELGIVAKVQCKKNRMTGRDRSVDIPIYHSHGIDDIGSCIDYLCKWRHWKATINEDTGKVSNCEATEFDFKGTREKLIKQIEDEDLLLDLQALVAEVWNEVEEEAAIDRKPRYGQT